MKWILILGFIFIIGYFLTKQDDKKNQIIQDWYNKELQKRNIRTEDIKIKLQGIKEGYYLIYTKDEKLFIFNNKLKTSERIKFNEILDVKIDAIIKEKHQQQILSLTPTFNKYTKLIAIEFKIITEYQTYTVRYEQGGQHPDNTGSKSVQVVQEEMDRMKLLIKRSLKTV